MVDFLKDRNHARNLFRIYEESVLAMAECVKDREEGSLGIAVHEDELAREWRKHQSIKLRTRDKLERIINVVADVQQALD